MGQIARYRQDTYDEARDQYEADPNYANMQHWEAVCIRANTPGISGYICNLLDRGETELVEETIEATRADAAEATDACWATNQRRGVFSKEWLADHERMTAAWQIHYAARNAAKIWREQHE